MIYLRLRGYSFQQIQKFLLKLTAVEIEGLKLWLRDNFNKINQELVASFDSKSRQWNFEMSDSEYQERLSTLQKEIKNSINNQK